MAFTRRVSKRVATKRPKRVTFKRSYGRRSAAMTNYRLRYKAPIHSFKRWTNMAVGNSLSTAGSITVVGSTNFAFNLSNVAGTVSYGSLGYTFRLDDLPNYTEFSALYDKYCVRGYQVRINAFNTGSITAAAYDANNGQSSLIVHTAVDHDDAAVPAASEVGVNDLRQRSSYRTKNILRGPLKNYVKSKSLIAMVNSSSTVVGSSSMGKTLWIDCAEVDVPCYGFKAVFEGISGGSQSVLGLNLYVKIEIVAYLAFRDVR